MASKQGLHGAAHPVGVSLKLPPAHACPCSPGHNARPHICCTAARPLSMILGLLFGATCARQNVWHAQGDCKHFTYGNPCTLCATQLHPLTILLHRSTIEETSLQVWSGLGRRWVAVLHATNVKLSPALSRFWVGLRARGMISHRPPGASLKHSEHRSLNQTQF